MKLKNSAPNLKRSCAAFLSSCLAQSRDYQSESQLHEYTRKEEKMQNKTGLSL
jgi:hypothetical protein